MNEKPQSPEFLDIEPLPAPTYRESKWSKEPEPIDGELLSGWVARTAAASHIAPAAILTVLRRAVGRLHDIDAISNTSLVQFLAAQTGHSPARFSELQRFTAADGIAFRPYLGPLHYCAACWATDPVPYVRWEWRTRIIQCCPQHGLRLLGVCPNCHQPLDLLNGPPRPVYACGICGEDLRAAKSRRGLTQTVDGQRILLDLIAASADVGWEDVAKKIVWNAVRLYSHGGGLGKVVTRIGENDLRGKLLLGSIEDNRKRKALLRLAKRSAADEWRRPLPVRCWAHLDLSGPVYELPPAVNYRVDVGLYDLLKGYARLVVRQRAALRAQLPSIRVARAGPADCDTWIGVQAATAGLPLPLPAELKKKLQRQFDTFTTHPACTLFLIYADGTAGGTAVIIGDRLLQFLVPTDWPPELRAFALEDTMAMMSRDRPNWPYPSLIASVSGGRVQDFLAAGWRRNRDRDRDEDTTPCDRSFLAGRPPSSGTESGWTLVFALPRHP